MSETGKTLRSRPRPSRPSLEWLVRRPPAGDEITKKREMQSNAFLADLKVGDEVVLLSRQIKGYLYFIRPVDGVTAKRLKVWRRSFNRETGDEICSSTNRLSLDPADFAKARAAEAERAAQAAVRHEAAQTQATTDNALAQALARVMAYVEARGSRDFISEVNGEQLLLSDLALIVGRGT